MVRYGGYLLRISNDPSVCLSHSCNAVGLHQSLKKIFIPLSPTALPMAQKLVSQASEGDISLVLDILSADAAALLKAGCLIIERASRNSVASFTKYKKLKTVYGAKSVNMHFAGTIGGKRRDTALRTIKVHELTESHYVW